MTIFTPSNYITFGENLQDLAPLFLPFSRLSLTL